MKSIKQQYIDLREGNMSQVNFMRSLRMTLPQYITNVTSFEDSIRILKNKSILTEADINIVKINDNEEEIDNIKNNEDENSEEIKTLTGVSTDGITSDNDQYHRDGFDMGYFEEGLNETISDDDIMKKYNEMFGANPQTKFEDVAKVLNVPIEQVQAALRSGAMFKFGLREAKDEKGRWTNTSGKSMYDQFKEIDNLNAQEVITGLDWEMEKNPELTKAAAAKIVIKNIKKNPIYYTMTDLAGKEGAEAETMGPKADIAARQMQYLDKNMSNVVDKKMGMQPVKGIEKPKKDSDKGGEANKAVKDIDLMSLIAKTVRGMKKMDATGEKMKKVSVNENIDFLKFKTSVDQNDWNKMTPDQKKTVLNAPTMQRHIGTKTPEELTKLVNFSWEEMTSDSPKRQSAGIAPNASVLNGFFNTPSPLKQANQTQSLGKMESFRERLKEMIRKELKETFDGRDNMSNVIGQQMDEVDIYGIAGNPEEEMAAKLAKNSTKFEPVDKVGMRDIELDDMLEDAENNIDWLVKQVGDDVELGAALINRARKTRPSLVPGLKQALNLYNK
jgi:hypothetical protein